MIGRPRVAGTGTAWPRLNPAVRRIGFLLLGAALLLGPLGCASRSPFNQEFVELRTPNFHLTSSYGDAATRVLARDLEVFHTGVLVALGLDPDVQAHRPTRVIAFDGRGVSRPFAERGAGASLLATVDGPVLMIRSTGTFAERVDSDLRHRYAHRILRAHSKAPAPLWYEEGRAQLAAMIEQSGETVILGRSDAEHRALLLDWRIADLTAAMRRRSLAESSGLGRSRFNANAWAVVQTILFDSKSRVGGTKALAAVRAAFEAMSPSRLQEATSALGGKDALSARIYAHLEEKRHRVDRMRVGGVALADLVPAMLDQAVARERLAEVALDLNRPALAAEYFERALRARADHAASLAGLVLTDALAGRGGKISERAAEMAEVADSDPVVAMRLGLALVASAKGQADSEARRADLDRARSLLERALELDPGRVEARVALGASFLLEDGDPLRARAVFEIVQRDRPGSLEVNLWLARVQLALGRLSSARGFVEYVLSRSHSDPLRAEARELLERIESRVDR